jgi:hypothetical protein
LKYFIFQNEWFRFKLAVHQDTSRIGNINDHTSTEYVTQTIAAKVGSNEKEREFEFHLQLSPVKWLHCPTHSPPLKQALCLSSWRIPGQNLPIKLEPETLLCCTWELELWKTDAMAVLWIIQVSSISTLLEKANISPPLDAWLRMNCEFTIETLDPMAVTMPWRQ